MRRLFCLVFVLFFLCLFVCASSSCTKSHRVNTVAGLITGETKAGWRRSRWQIGIAEMKPMQLQEAKCRRSHDCHWSGWACPKGRGGTSACQTIELARLSFQLLNKHQFQFLTPAFTTVGIRKKKKFCPKTFGIRIICSAAVHWSETKQQYLTLGCLLEKVSPAAVVAQIATFFRWKQETLFIFIYLNIVKFCRTLFSSTRCSGTFATCAEGDSISWRVMWAGFSCDESRKDLGKSSSVQY